MRVCNICKKAKIDVTDYALMSINKHHTYYGFDMCIECRDKLIESIKSKAKELRT